MFGSNVIALTVLIDGGEMALAISLTGMVFFPCVIVSN